MEILAVAVGLLLVAGVLTFAYCSYLDSRNSEY